MPAATPSTARYNYNYADQIATAGQVPTYLPLDETMGVHSAVIGDTFVVRPNLLNEIRLSFNRAVPTITNLNPTSLGDLGGNFPGARAEDSARHRHHRPHHAGQRFHGGCDRSQSGDPG